MKRRCRVCEKLVMVHMSFLYKNFMSKLALKFGRDDMLQHLDLPLPEWNHIFQLLEEVLILLSIRRFRHRLSPSLHDATKDDHVR